VQRFESKTGRAQGKSMKRIQSLAGAWEFRQTGGEEWLIARVPGGVHTDLFALGRIPDPFVADNEQRVQWVAESGWTYRCRFESSPGLLAEEKVFLVCDGLDTLATVFLNGHKLGHTDNMFRRYEWEVKSLLGVAEANEITITFDSPMKFIAKKQSIRPLPGVAQAIPGGPYLRKAPCQFGWDWGPQLPQVGIWKDIRLEGYSVARLADVHLRQDHSGGRVTVEAMITSELWGKSPLSAVVRITTPDGEALKKKLPCRCWARQSSMWQFQILSSGGRMGMVSNHSIKRKSRLWEKILPGRGCWISSAYSLV
jgi:beta-mannosidase